MEVVIGVMYLLVGLEVVIELVFCLMKLLLVDLECYGVVMDFKISF